jgi:pseudouridine synthase
MNRDLCRSTLDDQFATAWLGCLNPTSHVLTHVVAGHPPPIRVRQAIPTAWIEMTLAEGKNHQVRRMTAAVGHPTLRLVRSRIGPWAVLGLAPGEHKSLYVTIT